MGVHRDALSKLDNAFKAFFSRVQAGEKSGYPRFKSSARWRTTSFANGAASFVVGGKIEVPKLGRIRQRGLELDRLPAKQKVLRIVRRASGWYAQLVCEATPRITACGEGAVGIDLGLHNFAVLSTGESINNPRFQHNAERKLKRLQRALSRTAIDSARRRRARQKFARKHERVANSRRSFQHLISSRLIRRFETIGIEQLDVHGLARSRRSKSVHDAGWSALIGMLRYKAASAGAKLIEVDPAYTSQTCPECGAIEKKPLSQRIHRCGCGCVLDRDHAAALVILDRAVGTVVNARGGEGSGSTVSAAERNRPQ